MLHGPEVKIREDKIPDVRKQPELMKAAANAGELLGQRFRQGDDRRQTTQAMQAGLVAMFGETA